MGILRTGILLAGLTALFMGVGYLIGGSSGMLIAFVIAAGLNLYTYWNGDKLVLRAYHAREVDAGSAPGLWRMVQRLAGNAGLPMPRVYVMDNPQPNAFATGRDPNHSAVAVTTGIMNTLSEEELAGVIAHELAHIRNRDTLIMTITATIAGAISMLANFAFLFGGNRNNNNPLGIVGVLAAVIVAPLAAMLVQFAVSRTREYAADRAGAEISGNPRALASALARISGEAHRIPNLDAERNPAMAHLFIVNPLTGRGVDNLFSTHPAPENRINALLEMERAGVGRPTGSFSNPTNNPFVPGRDRSAGQSGPWQQRGPWS